MSDFNQKQTKQQQSRDTNTTVTRGGTIPDIVKK